MSYAIVVFEAFAPFAPRGFYYLSDASGTVPQTHYTRSLADAVAAADMAASNHSVANASAMYAVFDVGARRPCRYNLPSWFSLSVAPVYVPEACDVLWEAHGWRVPALPLNPEGPLELEDGTRLEARRHYGSSGLGFSDDGLIWHNSNYGELLQLYPVEAGAVLPNRLGCIFARMADGVDCGHGPDGRLPRVRNVGGVLPPAALSPERCLWVVRPEPEPVAPAPVVPEPAPVPEPASDRLPLVEYGALELRSGERVPFVRHDSSDDTFLVRLPSDATEWFYRETGQAMARHVRERWGQVFNVVASDPDADCDVGCDAPVAAPEPVQLAPSYEVRAGEAGTDRDAWAVVHTAESGKAAGAWVGANKALYGEQGQALAIVKVEPSAVAEDWREREARRMSDGTYTALPDYWAGMISEAFPDHFAHVAQSDKRKVAFTETEGAGVRDKQKVLSARAYASRFFGAGTTSYWGTDTRDRFVADMLGESLRPLFSPLGDADAIERIYRDTDGTECHGCMSYSAGHFRTGGVHPSRVYALGGEITVAFLRGYGDDAPEGEGLHDVDLSADWDGKGPIIARCLVWERDGEALQYGRVYGECGPARALRTGLEALGYRSGDMNGARIAKLEIDGGGYVMPYLDIGGCSVSDHGDYWVAGGDEYTCDNTDGTLSAVEQATCDHCGDGASEDEIRSVYTSSHETEEWCQCCRGNSASYSEHLGEWVQGSLVVEYRPSGSRYSEWEAEWLLTGGTLSAVEVDGVWWEDGAVCEDCDTALEPVNVHSAPDGDSVCCDCLTEREDAAAAELAESPELPLPAAA